jgi:hypothetical protein
VEYEPAMVDALLERFYRPRGMTPRGCHPRDLINQALLLAEYRGEPPHLTAELLETACTSYFVEDRG